VYEALSQGVPVIGARAGGIPEMVQDQVNGLLFEPTDPPSLERAISQLAGDTQMIAKFAGNARESVRQFTAFERMLNEHASLFNEVVNG